VLAARSRPALFIGISLTSSGAWDKRKKFIEEGNYGGKGSRPTRRRDGRPPWAILTKYSGPSINPMIKVVNVLAILTIPCSSRTKQSTNYQI